MVEATRHLHSSNLNLLEYLSRRLDDSFDVLNIFLIRCEESSIPETLTTKIRFLEELLSIHMPILNIITLEHNFVLSSNGPCSFSSAESI